MSEIASLQPLLASVLGKTKRVKNDSSKDRILIPNNGQRYLLFITRNGGRCTCTLYFVSCTGKGYDTLPNEFCLETDSNELAENTDTLLEGYLYNTHGDAKHYTYEASDIMYRQGKCVPEHPDIRTYTLTSMLTGGKNTGLLFTSINTTVTLSIARGVPANWPESLLGVFLANNVHGKAMNVVAARGEHGVESLVPTLSDKRCVVVRTDKSDVYAVSDHATNNSMGLLYVKTVGQSRWLREYFRNGPADAVLETTLTFNAKFGKWELDAKFGEGTK